MRNTIEALITTAMKNKLQDRLDVYRMVKAAYVNLEHEGKIVTDEVAVKTLLKLKSQMEDSINAFKAGNRDDLVKEESNKLEILMQLIPAQPTEEEIAAKTLEVIKTLDHTPSMKDMSFLLKEVQKTYPTASGAIVSKTLKTII